MKVPTRPAVLAAVAPVATACASRTSGNSSTGTDDKTGASS
ncbi:hypothetical protein [Streptomyces sp. NPDC005476]